MHRPDVPTRPGSTPARSVGARASSTRRPWSRREVLWLGGLAALALVVRLVVVSIIGPRGVVLNDSVFYLMSADNLASGLGYTVRDPTGAVIPTAQWPPGYSFVLSLLFRVVGFDEYAAQVLNAVLGAATVVVLYLLVRRLFGRRAAAVAAGILAVMPGPVLWADVVVAETLYTFALVTALYVFTVLPRRWWAPLVMGVVIGLATLIRGEGLLLVPAAAVLLWTRRDRTRTLVASAPRWALSVGLVVVVFGLTLLPWGLRNSRAMGEFIPLSTNSSITLWSGHNPRASGAQTYAGPELLGRIAQTGSQRELQEGDLLRSEAIRWAKENPGAELRLVPLKLINLMRGDGYVLDWVNSGPKEDKPVPEKLDNPLRTVSDAFFFGVLAMALLAVLLGGRRLWRAPTMRAILTLLLCSLVLYGVVYYGNYRYRTPLTPVLLLLAAPLLAQAWSLRHRLVRGPVPDGNAIDDTAPHGTADGAAAPAPHAEAGEAGEAGDHPATRAGQDARQGPDPKPDTVGGRLPTSA